jgi:hypothetical protein
MVPVYSMVSQTVVNIPLLVGGHKKLNVKKAWKFLKNKT